MNPQPFGIASGIARISAYCRSPCSTSRGRDFALGFLFTPRHAFRVLLRLDDADSTDSDIAWMPALALAARRLLGDPLAWIAATAAAMGIGLLAGAWVVGYGTSAGELAVMGAITGVPVGAAQAFLLRDRLARAWAWAVAMPLLWALGWTVTAAAGVGVDSQYAVFGAFGAITVMALSGILLDRLRAATPAAPSPQPQATATA